jgi:hypothetical protein
MDDLVSTTSKGNFLRRLTCPQAIDSHIYTANDAIHFHNRLRAWQ